MRVNRLIPSVFLLFGLLFSGTVWSDSAKTYTNSIGMEFVQIPSGSFMMGSDKNFDGNASDSETPQHQVTISQSFYLGKYEVTQTQWVAVMGSNPSEFKGRTQPVEKVSWDDVQAFIQRLNTKEGTNAYRLPTEAEWEYAARAGTDTTRYWGDSTDEMGQHAWFTQNSGEKTHPVGQLKPNAWGLYDMMGNVWEWVSDWYGEKYYTNSPRINPTGPNSGSSRVLRGGGWRYYPDAVRSAYRFDITPGLRHYDLGFRLSRTSP